MKKFLIGAAFVMISASAHAETYYVNGVTISVPTHCNATSCVSVDAPEYGYRHDGARIRAHAERRTIKTTAATKKSDKLATVATSAAATPAAATPDTGAPAVPAADANPATAPENSATAATDAATK